MKKSEKRKRTEFIRARVTLEEKAVFLQRCQDSGLTTGDYIRAVCLDAKPLRAERKISVDRKLINQAIGQLMRYGNNLNQIARKLNQGRKARRQDIRDIHDGLQIIRDIRLMFRQALGFDPKR